MIIKPQEIIDAISAVITVYSKLPVHKVTPFPPPLLRLHLTYGIAHRIQIPSLKSFKSGVIPHDALIQSWEMLGVDRAIAESVYSLTFVFSRRIETAQVPPWFLPHQHCCWSTVRSPNIAVGVLLIAQQRYSPLWPAIHTRHGSRRSMCLTTQPRS